MTQRKETIWNLFIIACAIILLGFLGGFVSGILDLGETAGIIIRTAALFLLISLGMKLFSHFYTKPLTQEMKEEEIKEAEQEDEKQVVFKPTTGSILSFLFLIFMGILCFFAGIDIISSGTPVEDAFGMIIGSFFLIGISLFLWYQQPVFIFAEDSVQIKSHLFYLLGIDRKTDIRYADITSVGPNPKIKANMWGVEPRHSIVISMNGTTQECGLGWFNPDILAKLYLRFKEKLGDKVTIP
jgi:hypothetical protein